MEIRLIVSDVDGTLIDSSESVPKELICLVKKCQEQGIYFCLSTGRTKELVDPIIAKLQLTFPCVISNGAAIYQNGHFLSSHGFVAEPIRDLLYRADEEGLTVTFSDESGEKAVRLTEYVKEHQNFGNRFKTYQNLDEIDWQNDKFQKIMIMDERRTGKIKKYQEKLLAYKEYFWVTTYSDLAVELGPKECNKATGVKELAKLLQIEHSQIMACGDFLNDLEMVKEAGVGVAVANACDRLKKEADYVAEHPYCYGVIEAAEKFCFHKEN